MAKYDGFMSYSHAADGKLAPAIQSSLHRLGRPWYKLRALSIFRDKSSLAADPGLWPSIERALSNSRWFIYLASPKAAQSEWVGREIAWWLANRDSASMLLVLTDGTIGWDRTRNEFDSNSANVLPTTMVSKFPTEPLWVDLCWAQNENNLSLRNSKFRDAILDIAAPLHGQPKDELDGDDVRQYRRNRRTAAVAIVALFVLTICVSIAAYFAVKQSRLAISQSKLASSRELAMHAIAQLDKDPELSVRLALHALESAETLEAERALRMALLESRHIYTIKAPGEVDVINFSPDGRVVALASKRQVRLADPTNGAVLHDLPGESGLLSCPTFSADSRLVAECGKDGTVNLWDVATGQSVRTFKVAKADARQIRFSPSAEFLVTTHSSLTGEPTSELKETEVARIWRVDTGERVADLNHGATIRDAEFNPIGNRLVTSGYDGNVKIWNTSDGTLLRSLPNHFQRVLAIRFLRDSPLLVTVDEGLTIRRWNYETSTLVMSSGKAKHPNTIPARDAWFGPDGSRVLIKTLTEIAVFDTSTGRKIRDLSDIPESISNVTFNSDGSLVALGGYESTTIVLNIEHGQTLATLRGQQGGISEVAFSRNGRMILTGGVDGTVRAWDLLPRNEAQLIVSHEGEVKSAVWDKSGTLIASGSNIGSSAFVHDVNGQLIATFQDQGRVSGLSFSGDGRRLLVARYDNGGAQIWDISSGIRIATLKGTDEPGEVFESADFSSDEKLVIAMVEERVMRWDAQTGERLSDLPGVPPEKYANDDLMIEIGKVLRGYSRQAGVACIATEDPTVSRVWDVRSGKVITELRGHLGGILTASMSDNGKWLALWNGDSLEIWDVSSGRRQALIELAGWMPALKFNSDGTQIVTTGGHAKVWDVLTGKLLQEFRGHANTIEQARFSLDGRRLVTASLDNTVKVWFADTGQLITTFPIHRGMVFDASFSPDGKRILTASADGTAKVLDCQFCFSLSRLRELAIQHPPRALTEEERSEFLHQDSTSNALANTN